ncbi:HrpE/YscL family type III secretion apparatus protein [Chlamydiifrater phoenicopteri]|uniref:HrpE/YscL family type III secretion apparatus protein n=1 Tax=Chlamydiifrater phoenicopteri TaxID=2681469 RepID=UPI001BCA8489|nr:HrpE/YscL family type III secretion apparatus protein [Chlamydiifrater phoenicopteri]
MKFFSLIFKKDVVSPNSKVLAPEAFSSVLDAQEMLETAKQDIEEYKQHAEQEAALLKETSKNEGFNSGLQEWTTKLAELDASIKSFKESIKASLVPLAIASVKKIIGKELETNKETVVSIISGAIKELSQNNRVVIFVNPNDLEAIEKQRAELKKIIEYAEVFIISSKPEIEPGGCLIETESGIINASLDVQLQALENAFNKILKQKDFPSGSTTSSEHQSNSSTTNTTSSEENSGTKEHGE